MNAELTKTDCEAKAEAYIAYYASNAESYTAYARAYEAYARAYETYIGHTLQKGCAKRVGDLSFRDETDEPTK
jgi:hypothetical protein